MSDFGVSSFVEGLFNQDLMEQQLRSDKLESERAYNRAINERNYMNQYNSPAQQMQRLKDAGLNPRLMYGQGNTGQQTIMPKYDPVKKSTIPRNVQIDALGSAQSLANINYTNEMTRKQRLSNDLFEKTKGWKESKIQTDAGISHENWYRLLELNTQKEGIASLTIRKLKNEISMQEFEIGLNKFGMSKKDSAWVRSLIQISKKTGFNKSLENKFIELNKKWR